MRSAPTSRGAAILEFALIAPFMFLVVFALLDISRYIMARAVMRKITQDSVNIAQKIGGLENDPRNENKKLTAVRRLLSVQAQQKAAQFGIKLNDFQYVDPKDGILRPEYFSLLVLRPGEVAFRPNEVLCRPDNVTDRDSCYIAHPTVCSSPWKPPGVTCRTELNASSSWPAILRREVLYIEARGTIPSFLPYLGFTSGLPLRAVALGRREIAQETDLPPAVDPSIPTIVTTTTITSTTETSTTLTTLGGGTTLLSSTTTVTTTTTETETTETTTTTTTTSTTTSSSTTTTSCLGSGELCYITTWKCGIWRGQTPPIPNVCGQCCSGWAYECVTDPSSSCSDCLGSGIRFCR